MEERFKCAVCVDLFMFKEEGGEKKVLLMKRKNTGTNDGEYELPGGHLENGEDIFDAMIRETNEEVLLNIERSDLSILHIMHHYSGQRINFVFGLNGSKLLPKIGEPDKCEKLEWFNVKKMPKQISPKMKKIISNINKNVLYDKM